MNEQMSLERLVDKMPVDELVSLATARTRALRMGATATVDPLIPSLERHSRLLRRLLLDAPRAYRRAIGRLAAETAWLLSNAYADNSQDQRSLHWGMISARLAAEVADHDLRAHALTRISRTYLSLDDPDEALSALHRTNLDRLSPYGRTRIEVHRALAFARAKTESSNFRAKQALTALDAAYEALLGESRSTAARPDWVWWTDDLGFLRSWEAEVLRSLELPERAVPVFRSAAAVAAVEDNRELPFLQAGLAEVIAQGGELAAAADEAVRAVILARAVGAEAALGRVHRLHRTLRELTPDSRYVRSLYEALRS